MEVTRASNNALAHGLALENASNDNDVRGATSLGLQVAVVKAGMMSSDQSGFTARLCIF